MPEEINPKFFRFFMRVLVSRKMNSHLSPTTTELKNFEPYHEVLIFSPRSEGERTNQDSSTSRTNGRNAKITGRRRRKKYKIVS